jgi:hypothetical protein
MGTSNIEKAYLNMLVLMHVQETLTPQGVEDIMKDVLRPLGDAEVEQLRAYTEAQYLLIQRGASPASPANLPLLDEALTFLRSLHF